MGGVTGIRLLDEAGQPITGTNPLSVGGTITVQAIVDYYNATATTSQVVLSATVSTIMAANTDRCMFTIKNAGNHPIYIGFNAGMTTTTSMMIDTGEGIDNIDPGCIVGAVYGIASTSTGCTVTTIEATKLP